MLTHHYSAQHEKFTLVSRAQMHTHILSHTFLAAYARTSQKFSFMSTADDEVLLHTYLCYCAQILLGFETIHTSYLELE